MLLFAVINYGLRRQHGLQLAPRTRANTRGSSCNRRTALQQRDWTRRTAERVRGDVNSPGSPSLTSMEATQCKCDPYWLHGWPDFSTVTSMKRFSFPQPSLHVGLTFSHVAGGASKTRFLFIYIYNFSKNAHILQVHACVPDTCIKANTTDCWSCCEMQRSSKLCRAKKENAECVCVCACLFACAQQGAERARLVHPSAVKTRHAELKQSGGGTGARGGASERDKLEKSGQP